MNRIKQLREEKKMTQVRLSIELGVTQVTVSGYEIGKSLPSVSILLKMSELFGVSCDYILGVSEIRTIMKGIKSDSDIELVSEYNTLTPMEQNMVKAYMQALKDKRMNRT